MNQNLQKYESRAKELEEQLSSPEILSDSKKMQSINREYSEVKKILEKTHELKTTEQAIQEAEESSSDSELKDLAEIELPKLKARQKELVSQIKELVNPADPLGKRNIIIEMRAGTGGNEAALFVAELFRAYSKFAEKKGWPVKIASSSRTDIGGFKEIIFGIEGLGAYKDLQYESGVHRVQRIPETEKAGRVHTSTITVAVLPEAEEVEVKIEPKDLKIEATTAGGHGGQSVNTTYSAVRLTHLPTNLVVTCQDERSQQQNKARAMQILRSRLFVLERERLSKERGDERRSQIGTGERSEKIRTYNFPQDRVTDHRINENFHNLPRIMDGNMDEIIKALQKTTA